MYATKNGTTSLRIKDNKRKQWYFFQNFAKQNSEKNNDTSPLSPFSSGKTTNVVYVFQSAKVELTI
jgi:hypothetical protein